ncbi:hypothetical protein B0H14DRAFT_2583263 [Mycena olivaceomarginata]|nr:hypothetical protein B0H14DRAFT_2583263 [Mycena olivaceomarginata]
MCDVATVPIVLDAVSLLPDNRYILLALVLALVIVYAAHAQRPIRKLCGVNRAIRGCEETLERAKSACVRNLVELTEQMLRLFEVKESESRIQMQLLETHDDLTTWERFVEYLQCMWEIRKKIHQCTKDLRDIQRFTLRTVQAEHQRRLGEDIRDCSEICDALASSSTRRRHHLESAQGTGIVNPPYETLASVLKCRGCERVEADIPAHLMRSKSGDMPSNRPNLANTDFSATEALRHCVARKMAILAKNGPK